MASFVGTAIEYYDFSCTAPRRRLRFGAVATTLLAIPACLLMDSGSVLRLTVGIFLAAFGPGALFGPHASLFAELFGTRVRYMPGAREGVARLMPTGPSQPARS